MRKSIVTTGVTTKESEQESWLDLEDIARVEITSEDARSPIENALGKSVTTGWRAAETGPQIVRLLFDTPQSIRKIHLHFVERTGERSQEYAVFAGSGAELREVLRQQWSFSPHGSTEEIEDHHVNLKDITILELRIDPDRSHDPKQSHTHATLQSLKLA